MASYETMSARSAAPSEPGLETAFILQVRFFGPARSQVKMEGCELPWPVNGTADEFWTRLFQRFPEIEPSRAGIRLARNGEFLSDGEPLQPGDEVALIPPVSGG